MSYRWLTPLFAAALCLTAQQNDVGKGVNFYSREKEAALGAMLAEDVRKRTDKLDNPEVQAYVERIGSRLATHLPDHSWTFSFAVIRDDQGGPTQEAIAVPGGYIFVRSSLLLAAQDEAEFAGMLAHAMAHVVTRFGTRNATRAQIANLATIPLIYLGGWGAEGVVPLGYLKFQRAGELEADRIAVPTMAAAGYDPAALLRYIARVQTETDRSRMYSPLPPRADRIAALEKAIGELGDFTRIQDVVRSAMPKPAEPHAPTLRRPNEPR